MESNGSVHKPSILENSSIKAVTSTLSGIILTESISQELVVEREVVSNNTGTDSVTRDIWAETESVEKLTSDNDWPTDFAIELSRLLVESDTVPPFLVNKE
jgi:hypothetical protein